MAQDTRWGRRLARHGRPVKRPARDVRGRCRFPRRARRGGYGLRDSPRPREPAFCRWDRCADVTWHRMRAKPAVKASIRHRRQKSALFPTASATDRAMWRSAIRARQPQASRPADRYIDGSASSIPHRTAPARRRTPTQCRGAIDIPAALVCPPKTLSSVFPGAERNTSPTLSSRPTTSICRRSRSAC